MTRFKIAGAGQREEKPNPGLELLPGLTGRAKWAVDTSATTLTSDKVGGGLEPRVEARWGACQKTVRGADYRRDRAYLETARDLVHLSRASMSDSSRPPRPRALFVAALLLLTLALAGAIALQAYRNFLGHKATAERVLRDYARLAAARFAQRTEMAVYWSVFSPAMDALSRAKANLPDTPLPTPASLPAPTELHAADFRKLARYTFATTCPAVGWRRRARRRPRACANGCATRLRRTVNAVRP